MRPGGRPWHPAVDACRAALQLDPTNLEARRLLIIGAVKIGDMVLARNEYRIYLGFDPPDAEALRRWIESQPARSARP